MSKITVTRYHDISTGHTVTGHESKCAHLHGHNYRIHFTCEGIESPTDIIGRVIDFSVIKAKLCMWLEEYWDHKFLVYYNDTRCPTLQKLDPEGVVATEFIPTAENMAKYLLEVVCPMLLNDYDVRVIAVRIEETMKCSAEVSL